MIRHSLLLLLLTLASLCGAQTTSTLRLESVFREPSHLVITEESLSKDDALTTSVQQRIEAAYPSGLPMIAPRGMAPNGTTRRARRPVLERLGRERGLAGNSVRLATENRFVELNMRVEIFPAGGEVIRYLLAPGIGEEFQLPAGDYSVALEYWEPERPENRLREEYPSQQLQPGWKYSLSLTERKEQMVLKEFGAGLRPRGRS